MTVRRRVILADDHAALRRGVRLALERGGFSVVAECDDADSAVRAAVELEPDVCLLDIHMPGDGISAAAAITEFVPATRVVMLTVSAQEEHVFAALRAGAVGYLLKDMDPARLPLALQGVLSGEAALPRSLVARIVREFRDPVDHSQAAEALEEEGVRLTNREWQVLELLTAGAHTAEIAAQLAITGVTVRSHVATILRKLHVSNRAEAIRRLREAEAARRGVEVSQRLLGPGGGDPARGLRDGSSPAA